MAPPPEQLYLLLVDAPRTEAAVTRISAALKGQAVGDPDAVVGVFNLLYRVRARAPEVVERLAAACISEGARDARVLVKSTVGQARG